MLLSQGLPPCRGPSGHGPRRKKGLRLHGPSPGDRGAGSYTVPGTTYHPSLLTSKCSARCRGHVPGKWSWADSDVLRTKIAERRHVPFKLQLRWVPLPTEVGSHASPYFVLLVGREFSAGRSEERPSFKALGVGTSVVSSSLRLVTVPKSFPARSSQGDELGVSPLERK